MASRARWIGLAVVPALVASGAAWCVSRDPALSREGRAVVLALGGAAFPDRPAAGLLIAGRELSVASDVTREVDRLASELSLRPVLVTDARSGLAVTTTLGDLGVRPDRETTLRRSLSVGRRGSFAVRFAERLAALHGVIDVPLAVDVDPALAVAFVALRKDSADTRPVSARYDFAARAPVPHHEGSLLDADDAVEALRELAHRAGERRPGGEAPDVLALPRRGAAPRVTTDMVASMNVGETLASYQTGFSRNGRESPRAHNIEVAAKHLDGLVLSPGEIVSFNAEVGPRTLAAGFSRAHQIYKGEMIEGVGGGTCQVASTLHAAAFYAGLDVVERAPHSRPLGYIGLGLDATVVYPEVDLKIRNPWNFPVAVHSQVEGSLVTVEVRGERKPASVLVSTATLEVWPFTRKIEVHPELASGRYLRKEKGLRGYDIQVMRRTTRLDGETHVDTSRDRYPPTPELFWVAPDLDVDHALPPLPEGAVANPAAGAATEPPETMGVTG